MASLSGRSCSAADSATSSKHSGAVTRSYAQLTRIPVTAAALQLRRSRASAVVPRLGSSLFLAVQGMCPRFLYLHVHSSIFNGADLLSTERLHHWNHRMFLHVFPHIFRFPEFILLVFRRIFLYLGFGREFRGFCNLLLFVWREAAIRSVKVSSATCSGFEVREARLLNSDATVNFGSRRCIAGDGVEELSVERLWKRVAKVGEALDGVGVAVLASRELYRDLLCLSDCEELQRLHQHPLRLYEQEV